MSGAIKKLAGPAFIAAVATDIYTPPAATIYTIIRHIHIANVTAGAVTASLFVGATGGSAAGTEILDAYSIAAHDVLDMFFSPGLKLLSTEFLSGLDGSGSSLTITVMGEQVVV
jgi:hypothetical protein